MADDEDWAAAVQQHIINLKVSDQQKQPDQPTQTSTTTVQVQANGDQTEQAGGSGSGPRRNSDLATLADESLLSKIIATKLREVSTEVKLEVQQKDPNSPLFSATTFEELPLSEELRRGLRDAGYMRPSRIQETTLPMLMKSPPENMIAQSQSGTGKTAAFSLAVLSRLDLTQNYPQAIILSPTYELALQTGLEVDKLGKFLQTTDLIAYAVKGNRISKGTQITQPVLIGTPGTLLDWITKFRAFDTKKVKVMVLDEADVMISGQGHKDQSIRIKRTLNNDVQSLLFSATYDERVLKFAKSIIKQPNIITLKREDETLTNIKQFYVRANDPQEKLKALFRIYGILGAGQAVVFCKRRDTALHVATKMNENGFTVAMLSGNLDVTQRAGVIRRFQQGLERVLISTNVAARGIDVDQVTMVVNFDLPDHMEEGQGIVVDCETYLHRIGRTGRFGKSGIAINMVSGEKEMRMMKQIEAHFGMIIQPLNSEDVDDMEEKLNEFEN